MVKTTLADLLLEAGTHHPDKIALITPAEHLTYSGLCCRTLQLAAYLVEVGLQPGDRVLICLPKCVELSTAIFGTLAIGGCYVPIDYTTPAPRVKMIARDAEPKAIICTSRLAQHLFEDIARDSRVTTHHSLGQQIFIYTLNSPSAFNFHASVGTSWGQAMDSAALNSPVSLDPAAQAYILYTSGSTGRPKGVIHTHESAMAFVRWAANHLSLESGDILSQHASPSFDLTVFDFFCSAMAGATLTSIPEWMFGQVAKTCRFIVEKGITVWYSVPSALLRQGGTKSLRELPKSALRRVAFAGEVLPTRLLREFVEYLPPRCTVSNWYGPTETNVCTFYDIAMADLKSDRPIPIGAPCPYAQIRLDSKADALTEASGKGELLIASPTVMEGYRNLDDLTAHAFTMEHDGRRYYKTGDIVTYDDEGRLLFLGRTDRLFKLKGYRIQPEEIEQILQEYDGVAEAAAIAIREREVDKLIAVVVTTSSEDRILADIKKFCAEMLPPHMVPSRIVRVGALPRGSRGKVDFAAVPKIISAQPAPDWRQ
jgi:L-proline---[L-prolyl-carrier protein] ligase